MKLSKKPYYKQPWYASYRAMMDRCYRSSAGNYKYYGGRGITVCDEWHDIDTFAIWCEYSGYKSGLTLDRIDVNKNYSPSNCRWVTKKCQANNRRNTVYVTIDGITKTISGWAEFAGLNRSTVNNRYCSGIRGVMLLRKSENTKFRKGYNRYKNPKHYEDYTAPTVIEAENSSAIDNAVKKYCDYLKSETYDFCNRIENGEVGEE